MKKLVLSTLAAVMTVSSVFAVADTAVADEWHHHHHHNNGAAIAGGVAAGVIGGLLAGAAVNNGPRYVEAPRRVAGMRTSLSRTNMMTDGTTSAYAYAAKSVPIARS